MTVPYTIPWERDIHSRISVSRADGYTWEDLLPFTASVDIASGNVTRFGGRISGIDGVMPQLDLVLRQDPDNKLNPQEQTSSWNKVSGQYNPLLAPMREIFVATAITSPGAQPSSHDWIGLFHGYLGDGIRVEGDTVRLTCRSLSKRLQETYVENPKDYGSESGTPVEDVIQDVLDDNGLGDVVLYCPEPTGFMVETYAAEIVQYKTVWDVLQALATAHDFFLGDLWDPNTEQMRLTLLVPPRDKDVNTADFVLNYRSDFLREEREIRDTAVKNVIIGHYWDKATNEKRTITVKDDNSIGHFGRRAMEVSEEATSLIQTEPEMITFLNAILSDLKDQQGTSYLSMPFFPQIGLFSGLVIYHPAMSSSDDFMGVESYRHSLDFEAREYRTEIVGSGRIRGGQQRWLKSETKPGSPGNPSTPPTSNVPPADVQWGHCTFITDVSLNWDPVRGATAYEIRTDDNWGYSDGIIYRGNGLSYRFAPIQREYTLYIRAINQAGLYSVEATPLTLSLPVPAAPGQPTTEAYFNALKIHPTPLNTPAVMGYFVYVVNGDVTEKLPVMARGDLTYPAKPGTTVTIQVSAYDVLGEGPKSEPMQATTTHLSEMDLPEIPKNKLVQSLQDEITTAKYNADAALDQVENLVENIPFTVLLSNENQTFPTDTDGVTEAVTTVTTDIVVFEGRNQIAATIGTVKVKSSAGLEISEGAITKANSTALATGHVTWTIPKDTLIGANSGYLEIPITIIDVEVTKRVMWSKARTGAKGESGGTVRLVNIAASQWYFVGEDELIDDESVRTFTPATIDLIPTFQNSSYSKWQYSLDGVNFVDAVSGENGLSIDGATKTLTVGALSNLFANGTIQFKILTNTGEFDLMTIARIYNSDSLATRTRTLETNFVQTDELLQLTAEKATRTEGTVLEHSGQIQVLGDEVTLKVQRRQNGELVVTGIGIGFDDTGQSIIPVLADRFMVQPSMDGEGQYAFMVDSETGKVYIPGDLTVGGLVRARELQVELAKMLLLQAELAYLDEANVLHLRADRITVGGGATRGFTTPKPPGSHLWHYDKHLHSTDGIEPQSATGVLIVANGGIAGGALKLGAGGSVVYDLPSPVTDFTWAGFYEEG